MRSAARGRRDSHVCSATDALGGTGGWSASAERSGDDANFMPRAYKEAMLAFPGKHAIRAQRPNHPTRPPVGARRGIGVTRAQEVSR